MNVLVTGGAGYIGSHACKTRYHAGYTLVSYGNMVYSHSWALRWVPLELDAAAGKLSAISIHGDDYDTPDGT